MNKFLSKLRKFKECMDSNESIEGISANSANRDIYAVIALIQLFPDKVTNLKNFNYIFSEVSKLAGHDDVRIAREAVTALSLLASDEMIDDMDCTEL